MNLEISSTMKFFLLICVPTRFYNNLSMVAQELQLGQPSYSLVLKIYYFCVISLT